MRTFEETKDPSELKDYQFTWASQLDDGETVTGQTVTIVDAAGTTNPANTLATPVSRVWLQGGTHGGTVVFTIQVTTSGGRTLEEAFSVLIVDSVIGGIPTTLDDLRADLAAVNAAIRKIVAGEMVKEVWRDGRRIVRENPSYDMLMRHKAELERKIEEEGNLADTGKRRRPIRLIYA